MADGAFCFHLWLFGSQPVSRGVERRSQIRMKHLVRPLICSLALSVVWLVLSLRGTMWAIVAMGFSRPALLVLSQFRSLSNSPIAFYLIQWLLWFASLSIIFWGTGALNARLRLKRS